MKHLDDRVSDLVDDRLDHDERDRALAHLAGCARCREAAEMERYAKGALTSLSEAAVPPALVTRLLELAEPGGPLPVEPLPGDPTPPVAPWADQRPPRAKFVDRHRRAVRLAAGGMVSTGALLVMLASLGAPTNAGRDQGTVTVVPPMDQFTTEYARSTGGLPFAEPASILVPALSTGEDTVPGGGLGIGGGLDLSGVTGLDGRGDGW